MLTGPAADIEVPGALVVPFVNAILKRRFKSRADAADENRVPHQIIRLGLLDFVGHDADSSTLQSSRPAAERIISRRGPVVARTLAVFR